MYRVLVGLLAALGVILSALVSYLDPGLAWIAIAAAATATGLAAYLAAPPPAPPSALALPASQSPANLIAGAQIKKSAWCDVDPSRIV
jgi:hypothetical protein